MMKQESIKKHLKPYSIVQRRTSTVAHAFASAIAFTDDYDSDLVAEALRDLGQLDSSNLSCVYCSQPAETWDHLTNLVKDKQLNGLGHQIRNLVPCCKPCNSSKRGDPYSKYIDTLKLLSKRDKSLLKRKLTCYLKKATPVGTTKDTEEILSLLAKYEDAQKQVLETFRQADLLAKKIRDARKAG